MWKESEELSEEDNRDLCKPFSEEEIKKVTDGMKSAGYDGFPIEFYQACWSFYPEFYIFLKMLQAAMSKPDYTSERGSQLQAIRGMPNSCKSRLRRKGTQERMAGLSSGFERKTKTLRSSVAALTMRCMLGRIERNTTSWRWFQILHSSSRRTTSQPPWGAGCGGT